MRRLLALVIKRLILNRIQKSLPVPFNYFRSIDFDGPKNALLALVIDAFPKPQNS